jgi:hypothetical protein
MQTLADATYAHNKQCTQRAARSVQRASVQYRAPVVVEEPLSATIAAAHSAAENMNQATLQHATRNKRHAHVSNHATCKEDATRRML